MTTQQMSERGGQDPMSACYVRSNFPVTLLMAYKYADSPEHAVLASANAGGENVNRNALLGAIMGAGHGTHDLLNLCVINPGVIYVSDKIICFRDVRVAGMDGGRIGREGQDRPKRG